MSTRHDPWGSGAMDTVEIATRNFILSGSVGLAQARPLTKPPAARKQPSAGLGPVTVHPTHSGVGPRRRVGSFSLWFPRIMPRNIRHAIHPEFTQLELDTPNLRF